ncbi:MAG TPA: XamI family restriction endonuclease [Rhizomicrobium sp.]
MSGAISPEHVANAARAKALYSADLPPGGLLADWRFAVRDARKLIGEALRASAFLTDISGALRKDSGYGVAFRHLMAPPISQDQFKLLCPQWSKSSENQRTAAHPRAAGAAEAAILPRLDPGLVRWTREAGRAPSRQEIRTVLKVAAVLIAQQKVATARRKRLSFEQEYDVAALLEADGWRRLPSQLIDRRAAVPPKSFMHKTRFSTKTLAQEVDIACGLEGTFVLAMECKVTNDETNSVKRINDILKKATAWHEHWGSFVRTAALLKGVVAPKDVQRLTDADVEVFWSHDLDAFRKWLAPLA